MVQHTCLYTCVCGCSSRKWVAGVVADPGWRGSCWSTPTSWRAGRPAGSCWTQTPACWSTLRSVRAASTLSVGMCRFELTNLTPQAQVWSGRSKTLAPSLRCSMDTDSLLCQQLTPPPPPPALNAPHPPPLPSARREMRIFSFDFFIFTTLLPYSSGMGIVLGSADFRFFGSTFRGK